MFVRFAVILLALPVLTLSVLAEPKKKGESSPPSNAATSAPAADAASSSPSGTSNPTKQLSYAAEYEQEMKRCMDTWDAGTSMTRTKWREVCHRTLKERLPYKRGERGIARPKQAGR